MTDNNMNDLMRRMGSDAPPGMSLQLPPPIFVEMGAEMIDYVEGQSLTVRFPVREKYRNPMGNMQGGMIVAAIDNTMGPLSFLVAPPSATAQLNTTYIRPIEADHTHFTVRAWVTERTRRQLFMSAEVLTQDGKRAAFAHATCMILGGE